MNIKTTKKDVIRKLVVVGALGALTVVLSVTRLGLIPWVSGASITILQVPVILGTLLEGLGAGTGIGAIFGICSLIMAATQGSGLDVFFTNPLISVLPRLLIAPATYFTLKGLLAISKKSNLFSQIFAYGIAAFVGALTNTVLVLGALVIAKAIDLKLMLVVLLSNGLLEAAASVVLCLAIVTVRISVSYSKEQKSRLSLEDEEELGSFSSNNGKKD